MHPFISLPLTLAITYRAYSHSSLTTPACITAFLTATIHALHPSPLPFALLLVFFVIGTAATKVKKEIKATLTLPSTGNHGSSGGRRGSGGNVVFSGGWDKRKEYQEAQEKLREKNKKKQGGEVGGGQEPRSSIQVLANSGCVSLLCLLHVYLYPSPATEAGRFLQQQQNKVCFGAGNARDLIFVGIMANYAAVTADTLSSELGILSKVKPRFILTLREVPPGTNGGVTGAGLLAGLLGAVGIGAVSVVFLPWPCEGGLADMLGMVLMVGAWGVLGSILDSVLGAAFQASVVDRRSGKVIEAPNGGRVKYVVAGKEKTDEGVEGSGKPSRIVGNGRDLLDNNQVNLLMAGLMTLGGMVLAANAWDVPLSSLWTRMA